MRRKILLSLVALLCASSVMAQSAGPNPTDPQEYEAQRGPGHSIKGKVVAEDGTPLVGASVYLQNYHSRGASTDLEGMFHLGRLQRGSYTLVVSYLGYQTRSFDIQIPRDSSTPLDVTLATNSREMTTVEVFGERYKQPEKLDAITRMPLRPSEQIQSISIISEKMLTEQGVTTVTDAARNVPGVTLFGNYGGVRESMSIRGYRGVPILKNGVRIDSDFRTASALTEMQGVESVQVIKGSAAVTQGMGNDLGAAGGVINVVTKTPKFVDQGEVALRVGSWGQVSPSFDIQTVVDKANTVAFRLNGLYSRADHYRPVIKSNRQYLNPSFEWRPTNRTTVTLEMDYMNDNRTPHTSAQNIGPTNENHLYRLPDNIFLGTRADNVHTQTLTYSARVSHHLTDKLSLRAAYMASDNSTDNVTTSLGVVDRNDSYNSLRTRSLSRAMRDDKNSTLQLDFIGRDVYTGSVKHTFQIGFDYRATDLTTTAFSRLAIDEIDLLASWIPNEAPEDTSLTKSDPVKTDSYSYGLMAQEVMTINKYVKAVLGLRYSYLSVGAEATAGRTTSDAWNPILGVMVSPIKNINIFGSYTTTTDSRSASNPMEEGGTVGAAKTRQFEVGVKSDWFDNRLRFNFTYFDINTKNLAYATYDGTTATGFYAKAGDLKRKGIETEVAGRIFDNLQLILGYSYLDAEYANSPAYENGSAPMNAPHHTANGWVYYTIDKGIFRGLSAGVGVYYVGKRPVNEWTLRPENHGGAIYWSGERPFDMPGYTTVNAQVAYTFSKFTARVFFNNIFDEVGYNSYFRGGFINQIDPFNITGSLAFRF